MTSLEEGNIGLKYLMKASDDLTLSFLDLDAEWDPQKIKEDMITFQNLIEEHQDEFRKTPIGPLFSSLKVKVSIRHGSVSVYNVGTYNITQFFMRFLFIYWFVEQNILETCRKGVISILVHICCG